MYVCDVCVCVCERRAEVWKKAVDDSSSLRPIHDTACVAFCYGCFFKHGNMKKGVRHEKTGTRTGKKEKGAHFVRMLACSFIPSIVLSWSRPGASTNKTSFLPEYFSC